MSLRLVVVVLFALSAIACGSDPAPGPESDAGSDAMVVPACGDGTTDEGEACDDGDTDNGDYCATDCSAITGRCGDGITQSIEQCDNGVYNGDLISYCNIDCTGNLGRCGDGLIQGFEQCDTGSDESLGCIGCFIASGTRCEGEPDVCGPDTNWDIPLMSYMQEQAQDFCAWAIDVAFGSIIPGLPDDGTLYCANGVVLTARSPSDCAERIQPFLTGCSGSLRDLLGCYAGHDICDFWEPIQSTDVAACEQRVCQRVCEPNTFSCFEDVARTCNELGNGYVEELPCNNGRCFISPATDSLAEACGIAVCDADTWACFVDNTARLCAHDSLSYLDEIDCGDATCVPTSDPNASMAQVCDVNECVTGDHDCHANATCTNTTGSFTCACNAGYAGDGTTCTDVNECANAGYCDPDPSALCTNTPGGATCACPTGYAGSGVGFDGCGNIDECAMQIDNCSPHADCLDTFGSYICTCINDHSGDGFTCVLNPALTSLVPSVGALSPDFRRDITTYRMRLPATIDSIQLTGTSYDASPFSVEGVEVTSGGTSNAIALTQGEQELSVVFADREYTITIERGGTTFLKASNLQAGDQFGAAVAMYGNVLVVGAPYEDSNATGVDVGDPLDNSATDSGAAYVFERLGNVWTQVAYLKASTPRPGAHFGHSVAIKESTIIVGAPHDASGQTPDTGAAYVFYRSGGVLYAGGALPATGLRTGDRFGIDVALDGYALIGADGDDNGTSGINPATHDTSAADSGAAYVFSGSAQSWSPVAYIKATNPGANDQFGRAVAVLANTLAIGAPGEDSSSQAMPDDNSVSNSGALYIINNGLMRTSPITYIKGILVEADMRLGNTLAIGSDLIVVGAGSSVMLCSDGGTGTWGRSWHSWSVPATERADMDIALYNNVYVVGTPLTPNGDARGSVFGARYAGVRIDKVGTPYFAYDDQRFGASVAVYGTTWAVGAPGDASADALAGGTSHPDSGAVYVF